MWDPRSSYLYVHIYVEVVSFSLILIFCANLSLKLQRTNGQQRAPCTAAVHNERINRDHQGNDTALLLVAPGDVGRTRERLPLRGGGPMPRPRMKARAVPALWGDCVADTENIPENDHGSDFCTDHTHEEWICQARRRIARHECKTTAKPVLRRRRA